ncbi:hypothetical protein [Lysobacter sp. P5_B9]
MGTKAEPAFGPLVEECEKHGISRTVAFELAANGQLDTFKIGARRYVLLGSLKTLPSRLGLATAKSKAVR